MWVCPNIKSLSVYEIEADSDTPIKIKCQDDTGGEEPEEKECDDGVTICS